MLAVREERELAPCLAPAALAALKTIAMHLRSAYGALFICDDSHTRGPDVPCR